MAISAGISTGFPLISCFSQRRGVRWFEVANCDLKADLVLFPSVTSAAAN
jgi:hypothetical protein